MAERQGPPVNGRDPEPVVPQPGVVAPEPGAHEVVGPDDIAAAAEPWPQVDDAGVGAAAGGAGQPAVAGNGFEAEQQAGGAGQQAGGAGQRANAAADGVGQAMEGAAAQPAGVAAGDAGQPDAGGDAGVAAGDAGQPDASGVRGAEAVPDAEGGQEAAADAIPAERAAFADENAPPLLPHAGWRRDIQLPWPRCEVRDIAQRRQRALRELPNDQVSVRVDSDGHSEGRPVGVVQPNVLRPDAFVRAARALQGLRDLQRDNMDAADAVYGIARGALNVAGELQEALESAHESSGYPASNGRESHSGYPASNGRESHSDILSSRASSIRPNRANDHVSIGISISQSQSASVAGDPQTKAGPKGRAMAEYRQQARRQASDLTQEDNE